MLAVKRSGAMCRPCRTAVGTQPARPLRAAMLCSAFCWHCNAHMRSSTMLGKFMPVVPAPDCRCKRWLSCQAARGSAALHIGMANLCASIVNSVMMTCHILIVWADLSSLFKAGLNAIQVLINLLHNCQQLVLQCCCYCWTAQQP